MLDSRSQFILGPRRWEPSPILALCGLSIASSLARFNTNPPLSDLPGSKPPNGGVVTLPSIEELQRQIVNLQEEFNATKAERDSLTQKLQELENSQITADLKTKSDLTEAQRKAEDAEGIAKATALQLEVERSARKLGIVDEDTAFRLLDTSKISYDKDGKPDNVSKLLDQLVKDKPFLLASSGGTGRSAGNGNPARNHNNPTLTLADVKKMSVADILANKPAVDAAIAAGK